MTERAAHPHDSLLNAGELHGLRSVGLAANLPIRTGAVLLLPPVVDTIGMQGHGSARPKRVDIVTRVRRQLLDQLRGEAKRQGASGLVGVRFAERETGLTAPGAVSGDVVEVTATAVPVTYVGEQITRPFSTAIDPLGVATLIRSGWVPVDVLTVGTTQTRLRKHRNEDASAATSRENREIPGPTDMIQRARRLLRDRLKVAVEGLGADGVLLDGNYEVTWSSTYHLVQVSVTASAIARWHPGHLPIRPALALPMINVT